MEEAHVLKLKSRKFSDFYLCFCGYAKCEPLHSFGPAVRPNHVIHIITKGRGRYTAGGRQYDLHEGQGFLIEPEVQTCPDILSGRQKRALVLYVDRFFRHKGRRISG